MGKSGNRVASPDSVITTTTVKSGPGGRKYTSRIEKSRPKYSFRVETKSATQTAIPDEIDVDGKHFTRWPGILKILQILVAVLCMIFFSPPLTWFTRILCAVVASSFAITIFICFFYLFTLRRVVFPSWPWLKMESIYTNLTAIAYLISSILQIVFTNKAEYEIALTYYDYYHDYVVAGVIGLINFLLYAIGGQLLHNKTRRMALRQPKVVIIRTTLDKNGKPIKTKKKAHTNIAVYP